MESKTACNLKVEGVLEVPYILLVCEHVFLGFTLVREISAIIHLIHNLYETHFTSILPCSLSRMAVCLMYYGVTFNAGNIGDFYLNFFLMGIVEFPGILSTILLIDRIGRKKMHLMCMMLGGIACLCTIFTVTFARESKYLKEPSTEKLL